jgi:hypothetical protein
MKGIVSADLRVEKSQRILRSMLPEAASVLSGRYPDVSMCNLYWGVGIECGNYRIVLKID